MSIPQPKHPWETLGYQPVRGLMDRIVSRYLRGQRKNMERFFRERGLLDSAERMRQIRLSRQGMLAKNRMFQEVLNDYTKLVTPNPVVGASTPAAPETKDLPQERSLALQDSDGSVSDGPGPDTGGSVPEMASPAGAGVVIEE